MEKQEFIKLMDEKIKLIRTEYGLTQEKMSEILGISKKTLVEIEKSRKSLGWTNAVALSSIFSDSTIIRDSIGRDTHSLIIALAFKDEEVDYPKTWGGKAWWSTIIKNNNYCIQQHVVSRHYRILNPEKRRIYASFNLHEVEEMFERILAS